MAITDFNPHTDAPLLVTDASANQGPEPAPRFEGNVSSNPDMAEPRFLDLQPLPTPVQFTAPAAPPRLTQPVRPSPPVADSAPADKPPVTPVAKQQPSPVRQATAQKRAQTGPQLSRSSTKPAPAKNTQPSLQQSAARPPVRSNAQAASTRTEGRAQMTQAPRLLATSATVSQRAQTQRGAPSADNSLDRTVSDAVRASVLLGTGVGVLAAGGTPLAAAGAVLLMGSVADFGRKGDQRLGAVAKDNNRDGSIGGQLGRLAFFGQRPTGSGVVRGLTGSVLDAAGGFIGGAGIVANRLAQQGALQAGRIALGTAAAKSSLSYAAGLIGANFGIQSVGIAADPSLTLQEKRDAILQNADLTARTLPPQLAFSAAGGAAGAAGQLKNRALDALLQGSVESAGNLAQSAVNNFATGKGLAVEPERCGEQCDSVGARDGE